MGCLIVGIFCHANLPGYPETLNTTLKDKASLSRTSRDIEGHFKGVSKKYLKKRQKENIVLKSYKY